MQSKETGVYQLENGNWEYRFTVTKNDKKMYYRKRKDENGNVFKTQAQAKRARAAALKKLKKEEPALMHRAFGTATVSKVYEEYCETGRFDKAYATIKKQDSLVVLRLLKSYSVMLRKTITQDKYNHYIDDDEPLEYEEEDIKPFRDFFITELEKLGIKNYNIHLYPDLGRLFVQIKLNGSIRQIDVFSYHDVLYDSPELRHISG